MARMGVAVIGAGPWGIALAAAAARTRGTTLLYSRRDLGRGMPKGVAQARDFREIGERARLIVLAVPSQTAQAVARELGDAIDGRHFVVHGVRGLAGERMETISEIVRRESPARRVGALGGPVLADELGAGKASVMVCGSAFPEVNAAVLECFVSEHLKVYATEDIRGLEWASALVGCLVIGLGYAQELGLGAGPVAAIITRAMTEASRIVHAAGGEPRTMLGLAGYGDLLASMAQRQRPELLLGIALAKGKSLEQAVKDAKLRVEAIEVIPRIVAWAHGERLIVPILTTLANGLFDARPSKEIAAELLAAPLEGGA
jgi:glycerol-3-phosphate dehydrogenase (NAD(P)+)